MDVAFSDIFWKLNKEAKIILSFTDFTSANKEVDIIDELKSF